MQAFKPDYNNIVDAARNKKPRRFPLYEHGISFYHMEKVLGAKFVDLFWSKDKSELLEFHRHNANFYKTLGYETVTWERGITSVMPGNGALGAHQPGAIKTRKDYETYPWDVIEKKYFETWSGHFEALRQMMPEGMKAIGGPGNGVFECVQDVVGYEHLCLLLGDDPKLYEELFAKVGEVNYGVWKRFMAEFGDIFCVLRFGDDLGYKAATMLPPAHIRKFIIPQYKKIIDLVHSYNKPFLLHSCGNLFEIMDDLIDTAGIDAKHSNEDVIAPFSVWTQRYGKRIGNFGGIDMDELVQRTPEQIKAYTLNVARQASNCGGIAFGSGNSIPDYVPLEGYLSMVNTIRQFRGEQI
jgi:uroporphyrinogen decarboxylase